METSIEKDMFGYKTIEQILKSPKLAQEMSDDEVKSNIVYCIDRLNLFRMGGGSSSLIGLSILLWYSRDRKNVWGQQAGDVEELLPISFRATLDPTFIQPEWGVVLAGTIIANYFGGFSKEVKGSVFKQSRDLLKYLESNSFNIPV